LILADWLEENGDDTDIARAELIRLQCRLEPEPIFGSARGPFVVPARNAEQAALLRRQDQLLTRYGTAWLGPLAEMALAWDFRRGMVYLEMDASTLLSHKAVRVSVTEPWAWVEGVCLHRTASTPLGKLADCPPLESVTELTLAADVRRSDLRALPRLRWFAGLRELDVSETSLKELGRTALAADGGKWSRHPDFTHLALRQTGITGQSVEALAQSGMLENLTALDLRYNRLGDSAVETLARAWPDRLSHLLLGGNRLGSRGIRALIDNGWARRLRHLDLSRNPLGPQGALMLAASPVLCQLNHLDLGRCQLMTEGARLLLCSPHLRRLVHLSLDQDDIEDVSFLWQAPLPESLRELDLSGNFLGDRGLCGLAATPLPTGLGRLLLGDCDATAKGIAAVAGAEWARRLTELDFSGNRLGAAGARAICGAAGLGGLGFLGLEGCGLDGNAATVLAGAQHLGRLACLDLADNEIESEGVRSIARGTGLKGLIGLALDGNPIDNEAALALIESPLLNRLSMLSLWDCNVTDAGVAALARSPGLKRISRLALAGPDIGVQGLRVLADSPYSRGLRVLFLKTGYAAPQLRQTLRSRLACCQVCWTFE
jgi:Ran GTPase-activating protein (RanGAP) involved in mRNA processing and transport